MKRVNVRFNNPHGLSREYCYEVPNNAAIGDTVMVPPSYWCDEPKLATITSLNATWSGPTKAVLALHKKPKREGSKPDYAYMIYETQTELAKIAERMLELNSQLEFISERV